MSGGGIDGDNAIDGGDDADNTCVCSRVRCRT